MDYREDTWRKTLAVGDCVRIQNPTNDAMEVFYVKALRLTKRSERLQVQVNYYGWVSADCLYALVSKARVKENRDGNNSNSNAGQQKLVV